jgi:hypothetical protein
LSVSLTAKGAVLGTFGEFAGDFTGPSISGVLLQEQRTLCGFWIGNNGVTGTAVLKF